LKAELERIVRERRGWSATLRGRGARRQLLNALTKRGRPPRGRPTLTGDRLGGRCPYSVSTLLEPIEGWIAHLWKNWRVRPEAVQPTLAAHLAALRVPPEWRAVFQPEFDAVSATVEMAFRRWQVVTVETRKRREGLRLVEDRIEHRRPPSAAEFRRRRHALARRVLVVLLGGRWSARQLEALERSQLGL